MPKYFTTSTLWYSGIFAAAATFDAGVKKGRREQWDKAIAEVEEQLGQPANAMKEAHEDVRAEATIKFNPFGNLAGEEHIFGYVNPARSRPRWPTNTGVPLEVHNVPPESIYATAERKAIARTTRWSAAKVARTRVNLDIWQLKLFLELQDRGWSEEAAKAVPDAHAEHILRDAANLNRLITVKREELGKINKAGASLVGYQPPADGVLLCGFNQDELGQFHHTAQALNISLQRIFQMQSAKQLTSAEALAKLSYNLMVSTAPPNIHTYNTLLLGLSRMQEVSLTDGIIGVMCRTHMRFNEVSLVAMLNHYTASNKAGEFVRLIERMRGKHGGLGLARKDIWINDAGKSRLVRKLDQPWKVIQLPYPTPHVFGAVIAGVIELADFDTALGICQDMGKDGWGLCMGGMASLIQDCARRSDWTSGLAVWKQIHALKAKSTRKEGLRMISERIGLEAFAAMLRLCSRCNQKEFFNDIWSQAFAAHRHSTDRLLQLVKGRSEPHTIDEHLDESHASEATRGSFASDVDGLSFSHGAAEDVPPTPAVQEDHVRYDHQEQSRAASSVLKELHASADVVSVEGAQVLKELSSASELSQSDDRPARRTREYQPNWVAVESAQLLEEQLLGALPGGVELEEYELRERPMAMYE